jgi:hypothetical protein
VGDPVPEAANWSKKWVTGRRAWAKYIDDGEDTASSVESDSVEPIGAEAETETETEAEPEAEEVVEEEVEEEPETKPSRAKKKTVPKRKVARKKKVAKK